MKIGINSLKTHFFIQKQRNGNGLKAEQPQKSMGYMLNKNVTSDEITGG